MILLTWPYCSVMAGIQYVTAVKATDIRALGPKTREIACRSRIAAALSVQRPGFDARLSLRIVLHRCIMAIQSYEKLIQSVRLDLPDSARAAVDLTLSYIRLGLPPTS